MNCKFRTVCAGVFGGEKVLFCRNSGKERAHIAEKKAGMRFIWTGMLMCSYQGLFLEMGLGKDGGCGGMEIKRRVLPL